MNELKVFSSTEFGELGVMLIDGKEYFPATQCAITLGYKNPKDAIIRHCNPALYRIHRSTFCRFGHCIRFPFRFKEAFESRRVMLLGFILARNKSAAVQIRDFVFRKRIAFFASSEYNCNINVKSCSISKRGSPHLRKTLFQVVDVILKNSSEDEPVYQFLDKKRAEGKPYKVYMMAAANKSLRIYYAKVKEVLNA